VSRKRGTQHLKHRFFARLTPSVEGVEFRELRPGDPIRCGTVVFELPSGQQVVFADYRLNHDYAIASGLPFDGCDEIDQWPRHRAPRTTEGTEGSAGRRRRHVERPDSF